VRLATLARSHLAHLAGAFLVMGSWAFVANRGHGVESAMAAALLQGAMSALVTLSLKTFIEKLALRMSGGAALAVPPVAAFAAVGLVLILLHRLNGTPEVVATIALPLTAATGYAAGYSYTLWRCRKG